MTVSKVTVTTHGVIFTGQARQELRDTLDELKEEVAQMGEREVKAQLGRVLKSPSGFYQSQITAEKVGKFEDWLIHDGGVVYGPWLESGKYSPPRRFKGYRTFKRVRARLRKAAIPIAQRRVDALVARWNS